MLKIVKNIKKLVYKNLLKRIYYRTGQCNRCGMCCQRIYVRHKSSVVNSIEDFEKLKLLHPFYTYLEVIDEDDLGLVFKCNNFDSEIKGCKIHKNRPGICRRYPTEQIFSMGAILSPDCGYKFVPIEDFSEVFENVKRKKLK